MHNSPSRPGQQPCESLSRPIPAPPLIAEAHATLFGDRDRILGLDEASLRMRHRGLDGDDHVGLQRPGRVIALIRRRPVARQARRFMTDEAHTSRWSSASFIASSWRVTQLHGPEF